MTAGQFLHSARKRAGFTQSQVAEVLGYRTSQFISNFERDLCKPPAEALPLLAIMYGEELDHLKELLVSHYEERISEGVEQCLKNKQQISKAKKAVKAKQKKMRAKKAS